MKKDLNLLPGSRKKKRSIKSIIVVLVVIAIIAIIATYAIRLPMLAIKEARRQENEALVRLEQYGDFNDYYEEINLELVQNLLKDQK